MKDKYFWYILRVKGGKEKQTIAKIQELAKERDYQKNILEFRFLPQKKKEKNLLPGGYIFLSCYPSSELVRIIYSVPEVISFLNHKKNSEILPEPLSSQASNDLLNLFHNTELLGGAQKKGSDFQIGDLVKISQGSFANCQGRITDINKQKKIVTLNVNFFGRLTSLDVAIENCLHIN